MLLTCLLLRPYILLLPLIIVVGPVYCCGSCLLLWPRVTVVVHVTCCNSCLLIAACSYFYVPRSLFWPLSYLWPPLHCFLPGFLFWPQVISFVAPLLCCGSFLVLWLLVICGPPSLLWPFLVLWPLVICDPSSMLRPLFKVIDTSCGPCMLYYCGPCVYSCCPSLYCCGPCLQEMKLIGILSDQRNLFI